MNDKNMTAGLLNGRMSMFLLGATLALGFTFSAYLIGRAAVRVTQPNHIFVKGSSMKKVKSDFGIWSGSICVQSQTLAEGYRRLAQDQEKASAFLKKQGFSGKEIQFNSITISENHKRHEKGYVLPDIENYILRRTITVSSTKVDQIDRISREFTSLTGNGIYARSHYANFVITDLDKYKLELLQEASRNALERAKVLAGSANGKVGALISAKQGVFQITAPASNGSSDIGEYDKSTIEKEIKAVVTLQFKVN